MTRPVTVDQPGSGALRPDRRPTYNGKFSRYKDENLENAGARIADRAGNSLLVHWSNGRLVVWSGKDCIHETREGESHGWTGKVLSIDPGNNAAMARVENVNTGNPDPSVNCLMSMKVEGQ